MNDGGGIYKVGNRVFREAFDKLADKLEKELRAMAPDCTCKNSDVIENTAMGKPFWVCRSCKTEVTGWTPPQPQPIRIEDAPDDMLPFWGMGVQQVVTSGGQPIVTKACKHVWLKTSGQSYVCLDCQIIKLTP